MTKKEEFCLDAYLINKDADMAYLMSRSKETSTNDAEIIHKMALRWLRRDDVQKYLKDRQSIFLNDANDMDGVGLRNKDDIVRELNVLASASKDPKQKTEILLKLADLQQMKKEKSVDEEPRLTYYLPLRCEICPWKAKVEELGLDKN